MNKKFVLEVTNLAKDIYYARRDSGPFVADPDELIENWLPPEDDYIVDLLTEMYKTPPLFINGDANESTWQNSVICELFGKAVGDNPTRIQKCRTMLVDPKMRRLVLFSLEHIHGNAKTFLWNDLIELVPRMPAEEINFLIEDFIMEDNRTKSGEGYQRILTLAKQDSVNFERYSAYLRKFSL